MKKLLIFIMFINHLYAEDKFLGIEMLSKIDKSQWNCNYANNYNTCTPKVNNPYNVSYLHTTKDGLVVTIILEAVDFLTGEPMDNYMDWAEPVYNKLVKQYGTIYCRNNKLGSRCEKTYNNTKIELVADRYPNVSFTHINRDEIINGKRKINIPNNF